MASVPCPCSLPESWSGPLGVFQLVGFVYGCYVVSVFTEEDSCWCAAARLP